MSDKCLVCGGQIEYDGLSEYYCCDSCKVKYRPAFDGRSAFNNLKRYLIGEDIPDSCAEYEKRFNFLFDADRVKRFSASELYPYYIECVDTFFGEELEENGAVRHTGLWNLIDSLLEIFKANKKAYNSGTLSEEELSVHVVNLAEAIRCVYNIAEYGGVGEKHFKCIEIAKWLLLNRRSENDKKNGLALYCNRIIDYYTKANDSKNVQLFTNIRAAYDDAGGTVVANPTQLPRGKYDLFNVYEARLKAKKKRDKDFFDDGSTLFDLYKEYFNIYPDLSPEELYNVLSGFWNYARDLYKLVKKYACNEDGYRNKYSNDKRICGLINNACINVLYFMDEFAQHYKRLYNERIERNIVESCYLKSRYRFVLCYYWLRTQINPCTGIPEDNFRKYAREYVDWKKQYRNNQYAISSTSDDGGKSDLDRIKQAYLDITEKNLD